MTTLWQLRRQAEEFAARVDAPGGSPVDARSDRLLAVVGELRRQAETVLADPRPDFAAELRGRLMGEAPTVLHQQARLTLPVRQRSRRERRLVAAATVAVLVGGSAGMAAASQHALPGEALYPVKRAIEHVQAGTATSSASKGRDLLSQASGRLEEVRRLLDSDSGTAAAEVPGTLEEFRSQARAGANELLASYRDTHDRRAITTLRQFAANDLSVITALSAGAPAGAEPGLRAGASTLQSIDREASGMCPDCTSLPPLQLPSVLAVPAGVDRALARAHRAGASLDNEHPFVVPKDLLNAAEADKPAARQQEQEGQPRGGGATAAPPASQPTASAPQVSVPDSNDPLSGLSGVLGSAPPTPDPTATPGEDSSGGSSSAGSTGLPDIGAGLGDTVDTVLPDPPTPTSTNPLP